MRKKTLPREVYYRCIWLIRDSVRLKELVESFISSPADIKKQELDYSAMVSEAAIERAADELRCIEKALESVPPVYRKGLIANIIYKTPFSDLAHPNTWKSWKMVFLSELAKELDLI